MLEKLRRLHLFDWFLILCVFFLMLAILAKALFPEHFKKWIEDYHEYTRATITVVLDPSYEWMRDQIRKGDSLVDDINNYLPLSEIKDVRVPASGYLQGRTLVDIRVAVINADSGPTALGRWKMRKGEFFVFDTPRYIFQGHIVDWKEEK